MKKSNLIYLGFVLSVLGIAIGAATPTGNIPISGLPISSTLKTNAWIPIIQPIDGRTTNDNFRVSPFAFQAYMSTNGGVVTNVFNTTIITNLTVISNITIGGTNVAVINPTDGRYPYRSSSNSFGDGAIYYIDPTTAGVTELDATTLVVADLVNGGLVVSDATGTVTNLVAGTGLLVNDGSNNFSYVSPLWTNQLGYLTPIVITYPVMVKDFRVYGSDVRVSKAQGLALGTNVLETGTYSQFLLGATTTNPADTILQLKAGKDTVMHLELMNYTNGVYSGRFKLPNNSALADLPGGYVRLLNGDWNGDDGSGIILRFMSPDWQEVGRWYTNNPPAFAGDNLWTNELGVLHPTPTTLTNAITISDIQTLLYDGTYFLDSAGAFNITGLLSSSLQVNAPTAVGNNILLQSNDATQYAALNSLHPTEPGIWTALELTTQTNNANLLISLHNNVAGVNRQFAFNNQTDPDAFNFSMISDTTLGSLEFAIFPPTGWTGTGTNYFGDDGKVHPLSGLGGATINPTDNYLPYRVNGTTFGDSQLYRGNEQTLYMRNTNNNTPIFYIDPQNTNVNTGTFSVRGVDTDGAQDMVWINGVKGTSWGLGTPAARDASLTFNVLHDNAMAQRMSIDGNSGTVQFFDRTGATDILAVNNSGGLIFGPGTTNVFYRSGQNLVLTNGGTSVFLDVNDGSANSAKFGVSTAGNAEVLPSTGVIDLHGSVIAAGSILPSVANTYTAGNQAQTLLSAAIGTNGLSIYDQNIPAGGANFTRLWIVVSNGVAIFNLSNGGTSAPPTSFSFRTNGVEVGHFP